MRRTHFFPPVQTTDKLRFTVRSACLRVSAALLVLAAAVCHQASAQAYKVTNLVSDGSVAAAVTDSNFINPWAASISPTWWISAQGTGFNYVISSAGTISFKVIVPAASGLTTATGSPTGSVTTAGATGMILPNGTKASFLFSTLDGVIAGWNSKLGTANALSQTAINNSAAGASYPGLAILNTATASYILAPNFGTANSVEVYDSTFKPTKLAGSFTDPALPTNYGPYSVHVLGTQVFVLYAQRTATAPYGAVDGPGHGILSVFDTNGNFVARAVTGGNLNSPWGLAFAPASFGIFSGDLLIGNEGDGLINVFDPKTYAYLGQLVDSTGKSLVYEGLWELLTGGTAVSGATTVSGGDTSTVYFTAGLHNEAHGLFAGISSSTAAGATPQFGFTSSSSVATIAAGSSVDATLSIAPVNGFSGTVTLACSGLPAGATCTFAPAQLTASGTAATTGTVTIKTTKAYALLRSRSGNISLAGLTPVVLFPLALILAYRLRGAPRVFAPVARVVIVFTGGLVLGALALGCGYSNTSAAVASTPVGQSQVVISATSGAIMQQTMITLTVQ
jgi:uncharacterized protein (TIGR03118 family)